MLMGLIVKAYKVLSINVTPSQGVSVPLFGKQTNILLTLTKN